MPSGLTSLAPQKFVAFDDKQAEVTIAGLVTNSIVTSFRTPPGLKGLLTSFRQAWDPGLNTFLNFSLRINGAIPANYNGLFAQIAAPEQDVDLPVPLELEQLSLVEMIVSVSAAATFPGNVTGRFVAKYFNP